MTSVTNPALTRIEAADPRFAGAIAALAECSGGDYASVMLEVGRRRASRRSPREISKQYRDDRLVRPASPNPLSLAKLEVRAYEIADSFEPVALAPVVPLGTHSVFGGVSQNRVLTTGRAVEVAADPTNALALEAAERRRELLRADPRSLERVDLCAVQRALRTQRFEDPRWVSHFTLLGLVSAGKDRGSFSFEIDALTLHVTTLVRYCEAVGGRDVVVRFTDFSQASSSVVDAVTERVVNDSGFRVHVEMDDGRVKGVEYYPSLCFKVLAAFGSERDRSELGDGGFVPWTTRLLANAKERLLISGLSLERVATAAS